MRTLAVRYLTDVGEKSAFPKVAELVDDHRVPSRYRILACTKLGGREINLSAWFDNPPENLLGMIRDYLDEDANTDDTLGGLLGPHD